MARPYWPHYVDTFDDPRYLECPSVEALVAENALRDKTKSLESDGRLTLGQARRALVGIRSIPDPELAIKTLIEREFVVQIDENTIEFAEWSGWMKSKAELDDLRQKRADAGRLGGRPKKANEKQDAFDDESTLLNDVKPTTPHHTSPDIENTTLTASSPSAPKSFERDFAECWEMYPRKRGRVDALKAYQARRKAGVAHSDLLEATRRYALERKGLDPNYTKLGSTFYGPGDHWHELLNADDAPKPPTPPCPRCGTDRCLPGMYDDCPRKESNATNEG